MIFHIMFFRNKPKNRVFTDWNIRFGMHCQHKNHLICLIGSCPLKQPVNLIFKIFKNSCRHTHIPLNNNEDSITKV